MRQLSERSQKDYAYWVGRFRQWLDSQEPTFESAQEYIALLETQGKKRNTISFLARALRREYSFPLPVPTIQLSEPQYYSIDEVHQIIDAAPSILERTIVNVLYSSGARVNEILNLTMDDLDLNMGVATVTRKGGRRERINLGRQGSEAIKEWLAVTAPHRKNCKRVFLDHTYQDIYAMLKAMTKKLKLSHRFHPHLLRHSRIRHLRNQGVSLETVSQIAGHTKVDTTAKIYGRLTAEDLAPYMKDY